MPELFIKRNRSRYADQLLCEARGLEALRNAAIGTDIDVPGVIQVDQDALTIAFIPSTQCSPAHWTKLGQGLASIHAKRQRGFGFYEDNYIGLNRQPNFMTHSWGHFFLTQRLEFQIGLIADQRRRQAFSQRLAHYALRLREFLDDQRLSPSLLHGDLWNGNVLCGKEGRVWLIDPACYFGDAETDLAMTELFGGFPAEFYSAYRALRPASAGWPVKKRLYNLYHQLNHLNLFGDGYLDGCEAGLATLEQI